MNELGVFARQPVAGACKTRLAATIGPERAAALADAFIRDTLAMCGTIADSRSVAFTPETPEARRYFESVGGGRFGLWPQPEGDLGVRLAAFFDHSLQQFDRTAVIGTDSPSLPVEFIERTFESLREHDCVLGPAADGGFYLIGLRRRHAELFDEVEWSTSRVLGQIVERLRAARFSLGLLPVWYDVDTWDDLRLLRGHLAALRHARSACDLPATAEVLNTLNPDAEGRSG
jgi:rSAM/selenodomain-associated transferase 1